MMHTECSHTINIKCTFFGTTLHLQLIFVRSFLHTYPMLLCAPFYCLLSVCERNRLDNKQYGDAHISSQTPHK